jgi:RHH-type proline utilization regulon transcriptional repressor/proline dehydrogenase/delta 1-pyrroline-5-carboxylate dehydrogenase
MLAMRPDPLPDLAKYDALDRFKHQDEAEAIADLLGRVPLSAEERAAVSRDAEALVVEARRSAKRSGVVESFLQQFSLNTREGLVLMGWPRPCCARRTRKPRTPLIAEKISSADWASHVGKSDSVFVTLPPGG